VFDLNESHIFDIPTKRNDPQSATAASTVFPSTEPYCAIDVRF
jgi:hypothetical protein